MAVSFYFLYIYFGVTTEQLLRQIVQGKAFPDLERFAGRTRQQRQAHARARPNRVPRA